jgi:hypothetical protein
VCTVAVKSIVPQEIFPHLEEGRLKFRQSGEQLVSLSQVASLYTRGLAFFHECFVPHLKSVLGELSGGVCDLADFVAYAAGSDVDFMTHLVEAVVMPAIST